MLVMESLMKKILIVGAGIAGLMMQNRLEALGYASILCEQNDTLRAEGAGLLLGANVVKIFKDIGLGDELLSKSQVIDTIESQDNNSNLLGKLDLKKVYESTGYQTLTICRQALFNILSNTLDKNSVWLSHKVTFIDKLSDGYKVTFENGKVEEFSQIIATDGLRSRVKKLTFMDDTLRRTNQACWRFVVETPDGIDSSVGCEMWGDQKRVGIFPLSDNNTYCFLVSSMQGGEKDLNAKEVISRFDEFKGEWSKIKSTIDTSNTKFLYTELADAKNITLLKNGIVFIGDAAHSTTPNMGQGAAMGIESAYIFSELLKSERFDFDKASSKYEKQRYNRVHTIREKSMALGKLAHVKSKTVQKIRNFIVKIIPDSLTQKEFEKAIFIENMKPYETVK